MAIIVGSGVTSTYTNANSPVSDVAVLNGGTMVVVSGGVVNLAQVSSGGQDNVSASGTVSGTVISNFGEENVFSGGIADFSVISGAAVAAVFVSGSDIFNSATQNIFSGGIASNAVISGYGFQNVDSGGIARFTVISNFALENVSSGGVASGTVISGATQEYSVVSAGLVNNSAVQEVFSGGSAVNLTISGYGEQIIESGGVAIDTVISSGTGGLGEGEGVQDVGGTAIGTIVKAAGVVSVESGGVTDFTAISGFGEETIGFGGVASDTTVSGGEQEIYFGSAIGTIITGAGFEFVSAGVSTDAMVENGGLQIVVSAFGMSPGSAVSTTVLSGGYEQVSAGAVLSDSVVSAGGLIQLWFSGSRVVWDSAGTNVVGGATISAGGTARLVLGPGAVVSGFPAGDDESVTVKSGGVASGTLVSGDGAEFVAGGVDSGSVITGGGQELVYRGSALDTVIGGGGFLTVSSGGVAIGAQVQNGGQLVVSSGGVVSGAMVGGGGELSNGAGGVVSGTTISAGGTIAGLALTSAYGMWAAAGAHVIDGVTVDAGAFIPQLYISSGGSISGFIAGGGVDDTVFSGGVAVATMIGDGGFETVSSGGVASGAIVGSGGYQTISAHGVASDTVVDAGGALFVLSGATASGASISGGGLVSLYLSGSLAWHATGTNVVDGVTISPGAIVELMLVSGASLTGFVDSSGSVLGGGAEDIISPGASTTGTVIENGGSEIVLGVASGTTVLSGGVITLGAGRVYPGSASDVVVSGGGALLYDGPTIGSTMNASGSLVLSGGNFEGFGVNSALGSWDPNVTNEIDGVTIDSGAIVGLVIESSGSVSGFINGSGAATEVYGIADDTVVEGGFVTVEAGGVASNTIVSSRGILAISAPNALQRAAVVSGSVVSGGGTVELGSFGDSSAVASGLTVASGGTIYFTEFGSLVWNAGGPNVVDGVTIQNGGFAHVTIASPTAPTGLVGSGSISGFVDGPGDALTIEPGGVTTGTLFSSGGRIDLAFEDATSASWSDDVLTVTLSGGGTLALSLSGGLQGATFDLASDGDFGTVITLGSGVTCFGAGTLILTPLGERPVETLAAGDTAVTLLGGGGAIIWVGTRTVDCARHPEPEAVWPVRVRAGAFGPGAPRRDLFLSPDHAVFVDGVLIPIRHLINGRTIVPEPRDAVTYHHVELEQHDVVLAEGLTVESYLDVGDRANFANGGGPIRHQPRFPVRMWWEAEGCAPLVVTGPILTSVRARLLGRAAHLAAEVAQGWAQTTIGRNRRSLSPA